MTLTEMEKEIIKAIRIESRTPFYSGDRTEMEIYNCNSQWIIKGG